MFNWLISRLADGFSVFGSASTGEYPISRDVRDFADIMNDRSSFSADKAKKFGDMANIAGDISVAFEQIREKYGKATNQ